VIVRRIVSSGGELVSTPAVTHSILEYAGQPGNRGRSAPLILRLCCKSWRSRAARPSESTR
jgi:hypothetical protein